MKKISVFLIALCAIIVVSCQSDTDKADKFRLNNEFGKAAELYKKAAAEGDAYAMWRLSRAYGNGDGVEYDEKKALDYLKRAAERGCEEAECDLAMAYMFNWLDIGEDKEKGKAMMDALVERTDNSFVLTKYAGFLFDGADPYEGDKDKALEIIDNIKDKNNPDYLELMGVVYQNGTSNISPDMAKAVDYFKKAFKYGRRYCAYRLFHAYLQGYEGLKADTTEALNWLQKGIEANQTNCMVDMSGLCLSKDSAFKQYHNVSRGIELLRTAANHGSSDAYSRLGGEYYRGENVEKDDEKSFEYLKKSAEMRNAGGTYSLGWDYINGTGCEKDVEKGIDTWKKAVEYGSASAANNLYVYYNGGDASSSLPVGPIDDELAKEYLLKAAKMGDYMACWNLGREYYWGNDLFEKNNSLAFFYIKKAADAGMIDACGWLAYFYYEGIGCDRNPDKAREYENKTKAKEDLEKEKQIDK